MPPLHASEARALMPRHAVVAYTEKLNAQIKEAAQQDKAEVRIDWVCEIAGETCSLTPVGAVVVRQYQEKGYRIREIYDCRQFVDIGMALVWHPEKVEGQ